MSNTAVGAGILGLFKAVAKEKSVKEKERIISQYIAGTGENVSIPLRKILQYALDDFILFGVTVDENLATLKSGLNATNDVADDFFWEALDRLRSMAGSRAHRIDLICDTIMALNEPSAELFLCILDKNLGCGVSRETVNKLFPKLLTEFALMRAEAFAGKMVKAWPVAMEIKYDGMRIATRVSPLEAQSFSRNGKPQPALKNFDNLMKVARARAIELGLCGPNDTVWFDGEIIAGDNFNDSISAARKKSEIMEQGQFMVFEALFIQDLACATPEELAKQGCDQERRARLERLFNDRGPIACGACSVEIAPRYLASSEDEVWSIYAAARENKHEGAIVKQRGGYYVRRKGQNWLKLKAKETADLKVTGAFEGMGKFKGSLGGLIVDFNGVSVEVGSGISDADRRSLWDEYRADLRRVEAGEYPTLFGTLIEVEYQEVTPAGSLRHPVFKRRRLDKNEVSF